MLVITLLSCSLRTLRRTTTCTSTQCTGSLLNWTSTPLTGTFYTSVLLVNFNFAQLLDYIINAHKVLPTSYWCLPLWVWKPILPYTH